MTAGSIEGNFEKTGVGVLDKSVAISDLVYRKPSSLAEIATELRTNSSTAHRLVTALTAHGFVSRDRNGHVRPG